MITGSAKVVGMRVWALAPLAALTISSLATPAIAEVDEALRDYTLVSWSTRDGLPSNFVSSLAQDAAGYLWVGTFSGLVRYQDHRADGAGPAKQGNRRRARHQ
jgi:ligand-binding sensor domain-containing protein